MRARAIGRRLASLIPLGLFAAALWLLHRELEPSHYHQALAYVRQLPILTLVVAAVLTVLGYVALTSYDYLGCLYTGTDLPYRQVALASFTAYAFSNTLGQALLTGAPLRFRLYGTWGVSAEQVTKIVGFGFLTFWVGFLSLTGVVFALFPGSCLPPSSFARLGLRRAAPRLRPAGGGGALPGGVRALARTLVVRSWEISLPSLRLALAQVAVSAIDWLLAAAVLYVLLPRATTPPSPASWSPSCSPRWPASPARCRAAWACSRRSWCSAWARGARAPGHRLLGALLLYRAIYYLVPLVLAALTLAGVELHRERARLQRAVGAAARLAAFVVPQALALTPSSAGRCCWSPAPRRPTPPGCPGSTTCCRCR